MKLIPKENGKSVMARSIEGIFFSTDMAAMDYEPCREEEIFFTAHWARQAYHPSDMGNHECSSSPRSNHDSKHQHHGDNP